MEPRKVLVTLIHGTWAKDAPWTLENSKLSQALRNEGYEVGSVSWDSCNRFTARRRAAIKLRKHVDDHNYSDHFVIAHSHGGNVAVRALDGEDTKVRGIICLNTPFINILGRDPEIIQSVIMLITVALSMIPVGLWIGYDYGWCSALLYLLVLLFAGVASYLYQKTYDYIQEKGQAFHFKPLVSTPFLCINTPDDEAYGLLSFLASLQNFLFLTISRSAVNSSVIGVLIGLGLVFSKLPFLYLPWDLLLDRGLYLNEVFKTDEYLFIAQEPLTLLLVSGKFFALFIMTSIYYFGLYALIVILILIVLSTLVTLSQGFIAPLSGLFNRFIVTLKPLKSDNVRFIEKLGDATHLRHSALYNDDETVAEILQWIQKVHYSPYT